MGRWREDKYRLYSNQDTGKQEAPNCAQSAETRVTWFQKQLSNLSCFLPRLDFYWDYFSVFHSFQKLAPEKAQWWEQNMTNLEHSPYHFRMCWVKYLTCMYVTRLWGVQDYLFTKRTKAMPVLLLPMLMYYAAVSSFYFTLLWCV